MFRLVVQPPRTLKTREEKQKAGVDGEVHRHRAVVDPGSDLAPRRDNNWKIIVINVMNYCDKLLSLMCDRPVPSRRSRKCRGTPSDSGCAPQSSE